MLHWWPGTAPWYWVFAASFWATAIMPKTHFRRPSWSWARKAQSIGEPELLENWLYRRGRAHDRKAKGRLVRQRQHQACGEVSGSSSVSVLNAAVDSAVVSAEHQAVTREQCEALHDEVERLPSVFRLPIVLCYFEGLTLDAAAQKLRWPAGTVRSRLARARDGSVTSRISSPWNSQSDGPQWPCY